MFRPRVIPVLLLKNQSLVKSVGFKKHKYIGDPINAVRIFNEMYADELVFLDILATREKRLVSLDFVNEVGEEANMPFSVGGGIKTLDDIRKIIAAGAEKVIIGTHAAEDPEFIRRASDAFGSSTIVVCIDIKNKFLGGKEIRIRNASLPVKFPYLEFTSLMEKNGAGELIIQSVDRDGTMKGYDLDLIRAISERVTIPVVALGGAGNMLHMQDAYKYAYATGLAGGSIFVYHGGMNGVLINYPERNEIQDMRTGFDE